MTQLPCIKTICTRKSLENYNNNDQQFNRHEVRRRISILTDVPNCKGHVLLNDTCSTYVYS